MNFVFSSNLPVSACSFRSFISIPSNSICLRNLENLALDLCAFLYSDCHHIYSKFSICQTTMIKTNSKSIRKYANKATYLRILSQQSIVSPLHSYLFHYYGFNPKQKVKHRTNISLNRVCKAVLCVYWYTSNLPYDSLIL